MLYFNKRLYILVEERLPFLMVALLIWTGAFGFEVMSSYLLQISQIDLKVLVMFGMATNTAAALYSFPKLVKRREAIEDTVHVIDRSNNDVTTQVNVEQLSPTRREMILLRILAGGLAFIMPLLLFLEPEAAAHMRLYARAVVAEIDKLGSVGFLEQLVICIKLLMLYWLATLSVRLPLPLQKRQQTVVLSQVFNPEPTPASTARVPTSSQGAVKS